MKQPHPAEVLALTRIIRRFHDAEARDRLAIKLRDTLREANHEFHEQALLSLCGYGRAVRS